MPKVFPRLLNLAEQREINVQSAYNHSAKKHWQPCLYFYSVRSSPTEVFLGKGVLKGCIKFTGEHTCRSAISIKMVCNFIEIVLRPGCSPVNLLYIFRTPFPKDTSGQLPLFCLNRN